MRKAALHNLGCKVNAYETEAMQQMLEEAGYEIVPFTEAADVYVINTCSVTNMADRKSRQMIHRAKHKNADAILVATGCYVQTKEEEAGADECIDIILGNNKKHELIEKLDAFYRDRHKIDEVIDINDGVQAYEELYMDKPSEHTRAFIKVQDGCNQFCSYCIIPYARGRVRSREMASVLDEVSRLAQNGYKEVVLTGIHLSSYGVDTGEHLLHLIQEIHKVEGIKRIRLGSLEPRLITEEFTRELAKLEKICPHFHLSLQSGCDTTLKRMNRKYTAAEYKNGCDILRKYFRNPAITTDVIVGFPGETEEEFEETKRFLEEIHFYEMHIFKYSKRQGTRAAVMPNQVPEELKTKRSNELLALEAKMSREFRGYYLGKEEEVLFEEAVQIEGKDYFVGYTKEYVKVAKPILAQASLKQTEEAGGEVHAEVGAQQEQSQVYSLENRLVRGIITGKLTEDLYLMGNS